MVRGPTFILQMQVITERGYTSLILPAGPLFMQNEVSWASQIQIQWPRKKVYYAMFYRTKNGNDSTIDQLAYYWK